MISVLPFFKTLPKTYFFLVLKGLLNKTASDYTTVLSFFTIRNNLIIAYIALKIYAFFNNQIIRFSNN